MRSQESLDSYLYRISLCKLLNETWQCFACTSESSHTTYPFIVVKSKKTYQCKLFEKGLSMESDTSVHLLFSLLIRHCDVDER